MATKVNPTGDHRAVMRWRSDHAEINADQRLMDGLRAAYSDPACSDLLDILESYGNMVLTLVNDVRYLLEDLEIYDTAEQINKK